jgi:hypothetical protein
MGCECLQTSSRAKKEKVNSRPATMRVGIDAVPGKAPHPERAHIVSQGFGQPEVDGFQHNGATCLLVGHPGRFRLRSAKSY